MRIYAVFSLESAPSSVILARWEKLQIGHSTGRANFVVLRADSL